MFSDSGMLNTKGTWLRTNSSIQLYTKDQTCCRDLRGLLRMLWPQAVVAVEPEKNGKNGDLVVTFLEVPGELLPQNFSLGERMSTHNVYCF